MKTRDFVRVFIWHGLPALPDQQPHNFQITIKNIILMTLRKKKKVELNEKYRKRIQCWLHMISIAVRKNYVILR